MKGKIRLYFRALASAICIAMLSFSLTACGGGSSTTSSSSSSSALAQLTSSANSGVTVPILAEEAALQTVTASLYLHVSDESKSFLEGPVYDKGGNLYICSSLAGIIYKITPDKQITSFSTISNPASLKMDRNGRLYICSLGNLVDAGSIVSCNADGSDVQVVVPTSDKYIPDDMVFRSDGSFYFCDYKGTASNPTGGVYYVSADRKTIKPVLQNLAEPNGLVISSDESVMYITEMGQNRLLRVGIASDGYTVSPMSSSVPYYFNGEPGCDSVAIDSNDNVYVAMFQQGRVLAFNSEGYPIGRIIMPDRNLNKNLWVTHCAFIPDTDQMVICCADVGGANGLNLFTVKGFAAGANEYQLQ